MTAGCHSVYDSRKGGGVSIVADADDAVVRQRPVQWAMQELRDSLEARGISARLRKNTAEAAVDDEWVLVVGGASNLARQLLESAGISMPDVPEALGLMRGKFGKRTVLVSLGSDGRGSTFPSL